MASPYDYVNSRIIVYDAEQSMTIADTRILEFDKANYIISLDQSVFPKKPPERVSVLIFYDNSLFEYTGTVRKLGAKSGMLNVALFKEKNKEQRGAKRYTINAPGRVERYIIAKRPVPLREPLDVTIVNLSGTGCLLRSDTARLNIGTSFELTMQYQETTMQLSAAVVHIKQMDAETVEYGCQFQFGN